MNPISNIRTQLGVTQAAMAEGLGVTQGNISFYERGQAMPPKVAERLIAYAKTLGRVISYDDIYGPTAKPKPTRRATDPKPQPARAGRRPIDAAKIMTAATAQPRTYTRKP